MSDEIHLHGSNSELILQINPSGWTRCDFATTEKRFYLGASTVGYIVNRLSNAITEHFFLQKDMLNYQLSNETVRWVMSLSERHHVLYATNIEEKQKLFWQDADDSFLTTAGIIILDEQNRREWHQHLQRLREKWQQTSHWLSGPLP